MNDQERTPQQRIDSTLALINEAGRHIECGVYESQEIQDFLKMLREELGAHP